MSDSFIQDTNYIICVLYAYINDLRPDANNNTNDYNQNVKHSSKLMLLMIFISFNHGHFFIQFSFLVFILFYILK